MTLTDRGRKAVAWATALGLAALVVLASYVESVGDLA